MASTVNILSPNGRRFNIKVAPNDTVMQVLERVCSKGNFSANDYDLKHQRSVVDVTISIRYANLPNHAKLEMVKRSKPRGDSKVHIALQVESGERLGNDFNSGVSLLDILAHCESKNASLGLMNVKTVEGQTLQPVCIYMRREIVGEAWLKHTTLKSLGLTGGKAVIRHMHRAVDLPAPPAAISTKTERPSASQQNTSAPAAAIANAPSSEDSRETAGDQMTNPTKNSEDRGVDVVAPEKMDTSTEKPGAKTVQSDESNKMGEDEQSMEVDVVGSTGVTGNERDINTARSSSEVSTDKQATMELLGARPKSSPAGVSSGAGHSGSDVVMATDSETPTVESFLQSHGTADVELDPRTRERIEQLMKREEEMMRQMNEVAEQLRAQQMAAAIKPAISATTSTSSQLKDFKFPKAPKKELTADEQGTSRSLSAISEPCDRRVLVFSAGDILPTGEEFQELPDNFFDVTANDMRVLISDLKSQQASDRPLETKAMREARKKKQMSKYSKVTVRVHFPDHLILQGFFRPQEEVSALYNFIQESLKGQEKDFYLYTTPPKTVLKDRNSTLYEAKLFPAAVVYFGSQSLRAPPYLSEDTLQKRVTLAEAEVTAFNDRATSSSQSDSVDQWSSLTSGQNASGPSQSKRRPPSQQSSSQSSGGGSSKGGQVPKWFKMGKR